MLLRAPGAHAQFSTTFFLGGLFMIIINPSKIHTLAILISGVSSLFLVPMVPKVSVSPVTNPRRTALPNSGTVQSTHNCTLALPKL